MLRGTVALRVGRSAAELPQRLTKPSTEQNLFEGPNLDADPPKYCFAGHFASLEQTAILALMAKALYYAANAPWPSSSWVVVFDWFNAS